MSLYESQRQVDLYAQQFNPPYLTPFEQVGALIEGTGRVARIFNRVYGLKSYKPNEKKLILGQELSDVIFTICCIANREDIKLQEEWDKMMAEKH